MIYFHCIKHLRSRAGSPEREAKNATPGTATDPTVSIGRMNPSRDLRVLRERRTPSDGVEVAVKRACRGAQRCRRLGPPSAAGGEEIEPGFTLFRAILLGAARGVRGLNQFEETT